MLRISFDDNPDVGSLVDDDDIVATDADVAECECTIAENGALLGDILAGVV